MTTREAPIGEKWKKNQEIIGESDEGPSCIINGRKRDEISVGEGDERRDMINDGAIHGMANYRSMSSLFAQLSTFPHRVLM